MTTGPIAVGTTCYPDFVEGQVLTHNDLNLLRDYLYSHWAFQNACLFGFGVACGLEGTIAGSDLTLSTGFALAQDGRRLGLDVNGTFALANVAGSAVPGSEYGISFLDGTPGGYTAVLVADDTEKVADETCTQQLGCAAHTTQWCEAAKVVFVAGRLVISDYTGGPVFNLAPVPVDAQTGVDNTAFTKLQKALAGQLNGLIADDALTILSGYTLDPKQPGIDLLKAGVLNEILFTLQDYERCKSYETSSSCCAPSGQPAVALGWLQNGVWDCTYRHHFQLSKALYLAMQGYRCQDLCQQYLDHIIDLIQNFVPPPPPQQPNNPPPPHRCTMYEYKIRQCSWWRDQVQVPQRVFPGYVAFDPTRQAPPHDPGDPAPWEQVQFGDDPYVTITAVNSIDPTNSGIVRLGDYLGYEGEASQTQLQGVITGDVQVVDMADFSATPAVVAAASDTVVLGIDSGTQAVVATGVIPTAETLQQVPAISANATQARSDAAAAKGIAEQSANSANAFAQGLSDLQKGFTGLETTWGEYQQTLNKSFSDFQLEFSGMPDIGTLKQAGQLVENWSEIQSAVQGAQSGVEVLNAQYEAIQQQVSDTGTKVDTLTTGLSGRVDQIGTRLDTQAVALSSGADVRRAGSINATLTSALDALGGALLKAAPQAQQGAVQAAVGQAQQYVEALRSEGSGMPVTETHPTVVADAMGAMLSAVEATGINKHTNAYRDLVHSVGELSLALGTQIAAQGVGGVTGAIGG